MTGTLISGAALAVLFYVLLVGMTAMVPTTESKSLPGFGAAVACVGLAAVIVFVARGILSLF